jgi:AraC-like DNA-binding protein
MALQESAGRSRQALHAANEKRSIEASRKNRKLAATALMRLGEECPTEWEDVALELILHSQYSWSQLARRLGVTRSQAHYRFRRLLTAAGVEDNGISSGDVPSTRRA